MKGLVFIAEPDGHYQADKIMELYKKRMDYIYHKNKSTDELIRNIKEKNPDYLVINYSKLFRDKSFSELGIPTILTVGDSTRRLLNNDFKEFAEFHKISGIITDMHCSIPAYEDYFQNPDIKIFWYKWGLNLDIVKDYGEEKVDDVIFSGKFSNYEFRRLLHIAFSNMGNIKYKYYGVAPDNNIPYEQYIHNLNKSWIGIGGCIQNKVRLRYKDIFIGYTFPKTLEVPAAASCLLNTHFGDEEVLGFKDKENCILFNTVREAVRKVEYYLRNKEELREITRKGYELVHKNHDINVCFNNLIDNIEKELS